MHFAEPKDKKIHDCKVCPVAQKKQRKCEFPGFQQSKTPKWRVDSRGQKYTFCPGKATWSPRIAKVFQECKFAYHTGILPKEDAYENQSDLFARVYPYFVDSWKERNYGRVWQDVNKFAEEVFKAIGKMFGGKK